MSEPASRVSRRLRGASSCRLILIGITLILIGGCNEGGGGSATESRPVVEEDQVSTPDGPSVEPIDYRDAFRFLSQATFGPVPADIDAVMGHGYDAWLTDQTTMPSAYTSDADRHHTHLERLIQVATAVEPQAEWFPEVDESVLPAPEQNFFNGGASPYTDDYQMSVWFENALDGPDQLRQRVAYALSQTLVTSAHEFPLGSRAEALAHYYDILARNALGNFRTLLGEVARSPAMGIYLSHQGNRKANPSRNTLPDENFARELMQLFTIGLYELNPDGTPRTDSNGKLIPTYDQTDIEEMARVMTGWDLRFNSRYGRTEGSYVHAMEFNPDYHDFGEKQVLGHVIPANLQGGADLDRALDILFEHANAGPFLARQLIQRLVTSNPSPAYVQRVAQIFADNGDGVRGDLAAVVRAVLLDTEARSASAAQPSFGKAREHLLAYTAFYRAFGAQPIDGWQLKADNGGVPVSGIYRFRVENLLGQAPLRAHHVFNFYDPGFVPQDDFYANADPQRVLPEMQLRTPNNIASLLEALRLRRNVYERNDLREGYGSVDEFVAQRNESGAWNWSNAAALVDYSDALAALEMAMEEDSDGDYRRINETGRNADGDTPKERGIRALLDFLEVRLLGARTLAADFREPVIAQLSEGDYYNTGDNTEREAIRTVAGAVQYVMLSSAYMAEQ